MKFLKIIFASVIACTSVQAQTADVPNFDHDGDFSTTAVAGNRGEYQQTYWLVVDSDPQGLNCRKYNGDKYVSLRYGTALKASLNPGSSNAVQLINGSYKLQVVVPDHGIQRVFDDSVDLRGSAEQTCYVRANNAYIAPINGELTWDLD